MIQKFHHNHYVRRSGAGQLLMFWANFNRREESRNGSVFIAINVSCAEYVQLLWTRANPRPREAISTAVGCHRGRPVIRRRSVFEAAEDKPGIRNVILDAFTRTC